MESKKPQHNPAKKALLAEQAETINSPEQKMAAIHKASKKLLGK